MLFRVEDWVRDKEPTEVTEELWGERGAVDRRVGLNAASGQRQLHKSFAERPNMSLLQVLQPIILEHPPYSTHSLHHGATFSAHLRTGLPGDVEGGAY
ncbi:hypothetical protein EYF80_036610 [Liparis tanakae]|uniref:Uncharacterized protein n=1 Tax=Liparis tanakae TaxID=230148 RepID=A0A4Z2GJ13_9TELE|nr:hypothetical protein EYF80_036610 [Liparis tanakae]